MKFLFASLSVLLLAATSAKAGDNLIGGDAEAGKAKSAVCAACHAADGNSVNPQWPKLADQHTGYLFEQLKVFKLAQADSPRFNVLMYGPMQPLSEQDMKDIAAYFTAQTLTPGTADPALVDRGERIYRGGIPEKNVPACIACHGPAGKGNAAAGFPAVGGQHAVYLVNQLKLYAAGERRTDQNQMMRNVAAFMSEEEMAAVASYMQGLR